VLQGIQIGNAQRIGHQASGRRSPAGAHRDIVVLGVVDKISDDQKIAREAHLIDHPDFIIEALAVDFFFCGRPFGQDAGPDPLEAFS